MLARSALLDWGRYPHSGPHCLGASRGILGGFMGILAY